MPDATRAFVKTCSAQDLLALGLKVLMVNTFHLYLQPGLKVIRRAGGLHQFMNWPGVLVSDSGGFQIFSLIHQNSRMGRIDDQGAVFKSPLDGSRHEINPEKSIQIQFDLGTDLMIALDDCPPYDFSERQMVKALDRTIAWARRSYQEYIRQIKKRKLAEGQRPKLIAVIQGGLNPDLRRKCLDALLDIERKGFRGERIDWDGFGFGGRPVDGAGDFLFDILALTAKIIPSGRIKFALGVGSPADIYRCCRLGWNMFDCVIPTREGRHGKLYQFRTQTLETSDFYRETNIKKSLSALDFSAINSLSRLAELRDNSHAYLHHLFKVNESVGQKWASLNNLEFYLQLMKKIRDK